MQNTTPLEQMNIVIVGHVDHGKSTLIGRLLADTNSLPEGKLEQVKLTCERNAKPFEYAFLLDALKDEQAQGITIDTARSFFKSDKRSYIIIDAPGHIEFLKNMVTGAARAEAALLLIDAKEGIQENSRRHGFMMKFLGIKQVVVLVNKMDLVNYDKTVFEKVITDYRAFLQSINVTPVSFIPIAAREGDNLVSASPQMPWYTGVSVLDQMDQLTKETQKDTQPFRFPVQDIYKFTEQNDDRRIVAGTVVTGHIGVNEEVVFYPSLKRSKVKQIEGFNVASQSTIGTGHATGFTLATQIYIKPGELMCKASDLAPQCASQFKANIFWLGKTPLMKNKRYKLKIGTNRATVLLRDILNVMDASQLQATQKQQVERHDVAECIFETLKPIAFDLNTHLEDTSRFVIVDDYEIAGGGIVIEAVSETQSNAYLQQREFAWVKSDIPAADRAQRFGQKPVFIVIAGPPNTGKQALAKALEFELFKSVKNVYFLGLSNVLSGSDLSVMNDREEHIRRLGETAHLLTDAGLILISTVSDCDDLEAGLLKKLVGENCDMIVINWGENRFNEWPVEAEFNQHTPVSEAVVAIKELLQKRSLLLEYYL